MHAPTRPEALSGLRKALREFQVLGLPTNLDFCERVAGHRAFEEGGVTTAFLEEHGDDVMPAPETRPPPPHAVVLASVAVLLEEVCFCFLSLFVYCRVVGSLSNLAAARNLHPFFFAGKKRSGGIYVEEYNSGLSSAVYGGRYSTRRPCLPHTAKTSK